MIQKETSTIGHAMNGTHGRKRTAAATTATPLPDVKVFLSRAAYPLGGTVVGTILIQPKKGTNLLRSQLESVTVYVAGFCKIDSRWHDSNNYTKIYGRMHPYLRQLQDQFDADLMEQSEDTVCFWATHGMEALDLPERTVGKRWNNPETDFQRGLHDDEDNDALGENNHESKTNGTQDSDDEDNDDDLATRNILAFTFRVDIPSDLPHSVHATTCRYFYTANVLVKTATQQQILKRGFRVVTTSSENSHSNANESQTGTRVRFGNCFGMAHSSGLPCHLSATEIHRPKGQLVVVQNHCLVQQYQRNDKDVQTIRVSSPSGRFVCLLTVIGSQSLTPGSRIHLQWDFPNRSNRNDNDDNECWIPCHQVSACLQGEEYAIYEDQSKKRTQSFLLDTCHEWVEPGVTDRVSKTLWLSSGNGCNTSHLEGGAPPCDLSSDIMEVSTWCQVDITVRERTTTTTTQTGPADDDDDDDDSGYNNLSLRIPCKVKHSNSWSDEHEEREMMEQRAQPLTELLSIGTEDISFLTNDIRSDLKTLSLTMEEIVCAKHRTDTNR